MEQLALIALMGFIAQLVDGALGMAYGTIMALTLLSMGHPPAVVGATVNLAEVFTCGASGLAHSWYRNIDWRLFARLAPAGAAGAVIGATFLSNVDGAWIKPFVAAYLCALGLYILWRAVRGCTPRVSSSDGAVAPLGLIGGALAATGTGWGPVVTSTLVGRGHPPRFTIGTVNLCQTFVAFASAATFMTLIGPGNMPIVIALIVGGLLGAPFGGYVARHLPARPFMALVGTLVLTLAGWQLWRAAAM